MENVKRVALSNAHRIRRSVRSLDKWSDDVALRIILRRYGVEHALKIPTYTSSTELRTLYNLARTRHHGAFALEIGSYLGASACYLGAGLARIDGLLFCVDTWSNETMPEGVRDTFAEFNLNTAGISSRLRIVRKKSECLEAADILTPLELVFIDGDHSYSATKEDFQRIAPWLSLNGIVAFHDCCTHEGVSQTLGEALASGEWVLAGHVQNLCWIQRSATRWGHPTTEKK